MNRKKKKIWDKFSFNVGFIATVVTALLIFLVTYQVIVFKLQLVKGLELRMEFANLMVQVAVLFLGIIAAFFALRQLVEARFNGLDEMALRDLRRKQYLRASQRWSDAFRIKQEPDVYLNLCEALLLQGDYVNFDDRFSLSAKKGFFKTDLITEDSDKLVLNFLGMMRHLLVKNQGVAENYVREIINLVKNNSAQSLNYSFDDIRTSKVYLDLEDGDCKKIVENTMKYISKSFSQEERISFEGGRYANVEVDKVIETDEEN